MKSKLLVTFMILSPYLGPAQVQNAFSTSSNSSVSIPFAKATKVKSAIIIDGNIDETDWRLSQKTPKFNKN